MTKSEYGKFVHRAELNFDIGVPVWSPQYGPNGVWRRRYSGGLVLVSRSSTGSKVVALPGGTWIDVYGSSYSGTAAMDGPSGLVLKES